jgi:hypothetical protein
MFVPLIYGILLFLYDKHSRPWMQKAINYIIPGTIILVLLFSFSLPFIPALKNVPGLVIRTLVLILGFGIAAFVAIKFPNLKLYAFVLSLIVLRMGFNWFIVERRTPEFFAAEKLAKQINEISSPNELFLLKDVNAGNFDPMSFHLSTLKGSILRYNTIDTSHFYIADVKQLRDKDYIEYLQFENYLSDTLKLVQFLHVD